MKEDCPTDIIEAKMLLEEALGQTDHGKRTAYFEEAFDILDGYILDYPESPQKTFIDNLRFTYTRKLLEGLSSIRERDIDVNIFLRYIVIFENKAIKELQSISEKYPNLKKEYESYLDFFRGYIV